MDLILNIFQIFDHTILSIMNNGDELWPLGGNEWSTLEKLHLLACKYVLGVPQSSPTDGIYAEPRRHPIVIQRKISIVKYFKRLTELPDVRLAKKAYQQLIQDDDDERYN